jgi:hypothetical protein
MRALVVHALVLALASLPFASCTCETPPVPPPPNEGEGEGEAGEGEGEGEGEANPDFNACVPVEDGPGFEISSKADLRWKRATPLKNDLMVGLGLSEQEVCSELGLDGFCFNLIHMVPLGANDPVKAAMYKPVSEPGATAPLAIDRVVLSACGARADLDAVAPAASRVVWREIDLELTSLDPNDVAIGNDVQGLYRRLLARDPTAEESALVASLAEDVNGEPVSPRDFAKMACYAVATTSEFIFH